MILKRKLYSTNKEEVEKRRKKNTRKAVGSVLGLGTALGGSIGMQVGDINASDIRRKGKALKAVKSLEHISENMKVNEWVDNAMRNVNKKDAPKLADYINKGMSKMHERQSREIARLDRTAKRSANKAFLKSTGKGMAIGTAVAAPLAAKVYKAYNRKKKK
jgi:hypothetical protein